MDDQVALPSNYKFAEEVPKKGASCATCVFLTKDDTCSNPYYKASHGSEELGAKPKRWCCSAWTGEKSER